MSTTPLSRSTGSTEKAVQKWTGKTASIPGDVIRTFKISTYTDDFPDTLDIGDNFGRALANLGDVDGDGIADVAVGATGDSYGTVDDGAVWILFMKSDGSVRAHQRIRVGVGGFDDDIHPNAFFASGLAGLGDLDGDGTPDVAVGSIDPSPERGLWILFLNPDGTVKAQQRINRDEGGFTGPYTAGDSFGSTVATLGDLDGDGVMDIVVGAPRDRTAQSNHGGIWIFFLNTDGTVKAEQKINPTQGGFTGTLSAGDNFGVSMVGLGDLDGDGVVDLAVGANGDDAGGSNNGAAWVLFLQADGTVKSHQKISAGVGGLVGAFGTSRGNFGRSLGVFEDLDGDGVQDLVVGATYSSKGTVWTAFLNTDGTVKGQAEVYFDDVAVASGGGPGFASAIANLGDLNNDGVEDIVVGNSTGYGGGSMFTLFYNSGGLASSSTRVAETEGGMEGTLDFGDSFGADVALLGDLDGDGIGDIAVGARYEDGGTGGVWIQFLNADNTVKSWQSINGTYGWGGASPLVSNDQFGRALAPLGDLDGDGVPDLAVGARNGNVIPSAAGKGAVWILFLNTNGTVKSRQLLLSPVPVLGGTFGRALDNLGDLDGDGVVDLIVGGSRLAWVIFLNTDGTTKGTRLIDEATSGLPGVGISFGDAVTSLGDLDGDGVGDIAIGEHQSKGGGAQFSSEGNIWILFLNTNGSVRSYQRINSAEGGFLDPLGETLSDFGEFLTGMKDLDGDGNIELIVGNPTRSPSKAGKMWVLLLNSDGTVRTTRRLYVDESGFPPGGSAGYIGSSVSRLGDLDGDGIEDLAVGNIKDSDDGGSHGAVWIISIGGVATLDFESGDDVTRTALSNGRHVTAPAGVEFGRTVGLTAMGTNLGASVFDSTPLGPNAASLDQDLLVGSGNVLIFQDPALATQTIPGTFDTPNNAPTGGVQRFDFHRNVEVLRIDLIDIDAGVSEFAVVTLIDDKGRERIYTVPANWTGDLTNAGSSGMRTLDLTSLKSQAGFGSTATAFEDAGFDAAATRRIEVQMGGSGAIDNLAWNPHPAKKKALQGGLVKLR